MERLRFILVNDQTKDKAPLFYSSNTEQNDFILKNCNGADQFQLTLRRNTLSPSFSSLMFCVKPCIQTCREQHRRCHHSEPTQTLKLSTRNLPDATLCIEWQSDACNGCSCCFTHTLPSLLGIKTRRKNLVLHVQFRITCLSVRFQIIRAN